MRYIWLLFLLLSSCSQHFDNVAEHHERIDHPLITKGDDGSSATAHLFYLIQTGKTEEAINALFELKQNDPYLLHDGLLEKLGAALLEQGSRSRDVQDLFTTLYGVGISQDERALTIAERALSFDDPKLQLVAVSVISSFDTEASLALLESAMKSNYIFVRLEAAYWLSQKGSSSAYSQLVALKSKVDPELHELFPKLFAIEGTISSQAELKRLLYDVNEPVRREAILAIADMQQDDFLSDIRTLASEPSSVQQEACAYALGQLGDEQARDVLERLSSSNSASVRLAAHMALYKLGTTQAAHYIVEQAKAGDSYAIYALASIASDADPLLQQLRNPDANVRVNATIALLERRDNCCVNNLLEILIDTHRDYAFRLVTSHGGSLQAWNVIPSSSEALSTEPHFFEISLRLREQALISALELPEDDFINIARAIFQSGQRDLIPLTTRLLENLQSEKAVSLLKEQSMRLGAPFVRAWCALALYRLNQDGPFADATRKIIESHEDKELFQARPVLPWRMREDDSPYQLTLEDSCALLIESFQALAQKQDEKGVEMLLCAIRDGNVHNRYTLAGLLMRSSL